MLKKSHSLSAMTMLVVLSLHFAGCSSKDAVESPKNENKEDSISFFTGKPVGTDVLELGKEKTGPGSMPVNALLWRAALDITSIVPLDDVDTFGGSIVTEWYAPDDQPYRRLKLAVFVVGLELRSDAIQVRAYVQVKSADMKEWITAGRDEELSRKLENLILTRARELRATAISETSN